jgi:arylsulfatase A-like enzyme
MPGKNKPNIVFVMCDDLGYGDVGFNGSNTIRTPNLDSLAANGIRFNRFMAGGPVCSPTRGTCLTGRHYIRYGINHANEGSLPDEEITLADVVKIQGYRTGHFGKWHLGTLSLDESDGNRGGRSEKRQFYSPPWDRGFDVCFSTESKVPTWDPMLTPEDWGESGTPFGTWFWDEQGNKVTDNLQGDDSRVIMDRALDFIRTCASDDKPFAALIWFHTPHEPVVAGPDYLDMYSRYPEHRAHYYGCVTAMDDQMGRLRAELASMGIEEDTMLWFCSDNGPEGRIAGDVNDRRLKRSCGSTGGLRGRKRSLFNGGINVPAFLSWPRAIEPNRVAVEPCSTLDYLPTISELLGFAMPDARPIDGMSLMSFLNGEAFHRETPIPFLFKSSRESMFGSPTVAVIDRDTKYLTNLTASAEHDLCFDITENPEETENIIDHRKQECAELRGFLEEFVDSSRRSHRGEDYPDDWEPITEFLEPSEWNQK